MIEISPFQPEYQISANLSLVLLLIARRLFVQEGFKMKCNFKKKIQEKKVRPDFMTAFNRAFVDGDFKDLIAPEAMNKSLLQLLKDQSSLCD